MRVQPVSVFLSSTCYDLGDLRFEVADALRKDAFVVKLSEDPGSAFYVDPLDDSIASCLANVEASDAVVCFIDRRYGGILKNPPNNGLSATHVEVRHARSLGKPVFFFVREPAYREYEQLRANPNYTTNWVEPHNPSSRTAWAGFMKEISALPPHKGWSNWFDLFKTSIDLKPLVRKRLSDYFPGQLGTVALDPDHIVRVTFIRDAPGTAEAKGSFRNIGPGPALNISHGSQVGAKEITRAYHGGLREGEDLVEHGQPCRYALPQPNDPKEERIIFCEYENRFGDGYRIEVPLYSKPNHTLQFSTERFLVRTGPGNWLPVTP